MAKFRIRNIVAAKGMTLKGLAEKTGITPRILSNLINEKNNPDIAMLESIAQALDVPVASLFTDYLSPNSTIIICPHCGARIDIMTGRTK